MPHSRHSKNRRRRIHSESVDDLFIVGIDAEWQSEGDRNRLLSFQWSVLHRGREETGIKFYPNGERPSLAELVQTILSECKRKSIFSHYPKFIYLVCHFSLAELTILKDFKVLKSKFDSIRGSFTTLTDPLEIKVTDPNRNQRTIELFLRDSLHLTPQGARLEVLGKIHGIPKVELPPGAIENMAELLETDPQLFEKYAITDARIAALHAYAMAKLNLELTGRCDIPITLGGFALKFAQTLWTEFDIDVLEVLGSEEVTRDEFDSATGRMKKRKKRVLIPALHEQEAIAVESYHGGRNEAFQFGPSTVDDWIDVDLKGAYSTALASIGMPRWHEIRSTTNPTDFNAQVIGAARIQFKFPADERFPTMPVRLSNNLIFPLEGETYATSPEIELALTLGASIKILSGYVVPMDNSYRPFEMVISECTKRRNQAKRDGDDLGNRFYKEMVNSLYGKTAQGLREKRVFDSRTAERRDLPPSKITQPFIASYVTGLVRTALGELMNSVGVDQEIISVTTDGFITNATLEELESKANGPTCTILRNSRERLVQDSSILEVKHSVQRVLCFRTRGQATLEAGIEDSIPLLAKAGIKPPANVVGAERQNEWMIQQFFERDPETTFQYESLKTLRMLYDSDGDLVSGSHRRRLGMEFDFKRKPTLRWMGIYGGYPAHLVFVTEPFRSKAEHEQYREGWKRFAKSGRSLKTVQDLRDFEEYLAGERLIVCGINRSSQGLAKVAMRQFIRRLVRGICGLDQRTEEFSYSELACRLSGSGIEVSVNDLKNAGRSASKPVSHSIPRTPEVMELIRYLLQHFPKWNVEELLEPGSILTKQESKMFTPLNGVDNSTNEVPMIVDRKSTKTNVNS